MVNENDVFDLIPELIDDNQPEDLNNDTVQEQPITEEPDIIEEPQEEFEEQIPEESDDAELAKSFYALLQERQLVPEKEVNSWEELEEEIDKYKTSLPEQVRESIIQSTSTVAQDFVNFAINKPNLTQEDLTAYFNAFQEDQSISNIQTNEQAREVLRPSLIEQWGEDTADIMLDSLEDNNQLIEKAKNQKEAQSKKLTEQAIKQREAEEQRNQEFVNNIFQSFDEQPWKKEHTQSVKEFYSNGKADETIQQITNDPKSLVQLVNILSYYDTEKKEFNLDTFFNKAATKSVNSIRDNIKRGLQNRGTSTKQKPVQDEFDLSKYELI